MEISKKDLEKSQLEISVVLSAEEFAPYIEKGATAVSEKTNIEGFRPGKAPYEILKQKVGEMAILEEAANIVIRKNIDKILDEHTAGRQIIGQPQVDIVKLAPANSLELKITLTLLPEIALGAYKDLKIKEAEVKVDSEKIKKTLNDLAEMRAKETLSETAVKDGDKVIANFEMFLDKVPIETGQAQDVTVVIGKDYLIPGFDKKIIGAIKDQVLDFSLPYPADHHDKNLAGKMVEFKVKIKEVYNREIPPADEEMAISFGFKSLEDLEKALSENVIAQEKQKAEQRAEIEMLDKIISTTKFGDLPESLIQNETDLMIGELEASIKNQGGNLEDYLTSIGKSKTQLLLDFAPNALKRVKSSLILREVAVVEKIMIEHQEIHDKIDELKAQYKGDEKIAKMFDEPGYHAYLGNILANQKVIKKLREWNIE